MKTLKNVVTAYKLAVLEILRNISIYCVSMLSLHIESTDSMIDISSQRKLTQADGLLDPFVLHSHKLFDKSDTAFISLKFYIF